MVVTGIGIVAPLKPFTSTGDFWSSLCAGEDGIRRMPLPLLEIEGVWPMAVIDMPAPAAISPEDKALYIAAKALSMALADAGLPAPQRAGLSVGTVLGNVVLKEKRLLAEGGRQPRGIAGEESLARVTPRLAETFGLQGQKVTVSTACASGTDAIGIAARKIADGSAEVMVAGGVDVVSDFALLGFHALQALARDKVRPFDKRRTGLALGEGAAFVVLESELHAKERRARLYGAVRGYASRADAHHLTGPHKEGRGLADAVERALADAAYSPIEVSYINAHGTGTMYNDLMETKAIKRVFGASAYGIPVSSTKSMLGHSFGAAGAIEAVCCLLAITHKRVPPTINFSERDPECDLDYVPNEARDLDVKIALSLSAGFGGQNAVLVLGAP